MAIRQLLSGSCLHASRMPAAVLHAAAHRKDGASPDAFQNHAQKIKVHSAAEEQIRAASLKWKACCLLSSAVSVSGKQATPACRILVTIRLISSTKKGLCCLEVMLGKHPALEAMSKQCTTNKRGRVWRRPSFAAYCRRWTEWAPSCASCDEIQKATQWTCS